MAILPIFFIHRGGHRYLWVSIMQARFFNPDAPIILIGDEAAQKVHRQKFSHMNVTFANYHDYLEDDRGDFRDIYVHYSGNSYDWECFCIERWIVLKNYLKSQNIPKCFYLDTDVLLYTKVDETIPCLRGKAGGIFFLGTPTEKIVKSLHTSYFSLSVLQEFCDYIFSAYRDPACVEKMKEYHETLKIPFSDMSLAAWFFEADQLAGITDLFIPTKDEATDTIPAMFDNGITHGSLYMRTRDGKRKKLIWQKYYGQRVPYIISKSDQSFVRLRSIHFQGGPDIKDMLIKYSFLKIRWFIFMAQKLDDFSFRVKRKIKLFLKK